MTEQLRIAYLGPSGTYSEQVAQSLNADVKGAEYVPLKSIPRVIETVARGDAEVCVVPLRASQDVNDSLVSLYGRIRQAEEGKVNRVYITGYGEAPIQFYLAAKPEARIQDIDTVASKQEAIDHCRSELEDLLEDYGPRYTESTAEGARLVVSSSGSNIATLCSLKALGDNGLVSLLPEPIQKYTAFIRIGAEPYSGTREDETAIMISFYQDRPGQLLSIVSSIYPVNMTDLHLLKNMKDYSGIAKHVFVVRLEADSGQADLVTKKMIKEFPEGNGTKIDVLGTYPIINLDK